MAYTTREELTEVVQDGLHISMCDFEPQKDNDTRCAVCNERKWDVHHVAVDFVAEMITKAYNKGVEDGKNSR